MFPNECLHLGFDLGVYGASSIVTLGVPSVLEYACSLWTLGFARGNSPGAIALQEGLDVILL